MGTVHQFAYGVINPLLAYGMAFVGSVLGLSCTARARIATSHSRQRRWLAIASMSIGGGIWLMHFMAMLGFDVAGTPVRYHAALTGVSAVMATAVVGVGLFSVGTNGQSVAKLIVGGAFTGSGVAAMHYTGMFAMQLSGQVTYDPALVVASVILAILSATVALWLSVVIQGRWPILIAAAVMAVAVCVMHYTGMAAVHVHLDEDPHPVGGVNPIELGLPITLIAAATLIGLMFTALYTIAQEDAILPVNLIAPVRERDMRRALPQSGSLAAVNRRQPSTDPVRRLTARRLWQG